MKKLINEKSTKNQNNFKNKNELMFNPLDYPMCFDLPLRVTGGSAWVNFIPLAFIIVQMLKPKIFVELGTHKGDSYCAFCQAVDTLGLNTSCYAVDSWEGDAHTGKYSNKILTDLRDYHNPKYGNFSKLIQSKFDDALNLFSDDSVDLLHIDGLHTYEAVKHDFETWLPKMSKKGVILFHDTNVHEYNFGVWRLWKEVKDKYPSFEFEYVYGLGVIAVGTKVTNDFLLFLNTAKNNPKLFSNFFYFLNDKITSRDLVDSKNSEIGNLNSEIGNLNNEINEFRSNLQVIQRNVGW